MRLGELSAHIGLDIFDGLILCSGFAPFSEVELMRLILLLILLTFSGCSAPLFGPDRHIVQRFGSVDSLEIQIETSKTVKNVKISDSVTIQQFEEIYKRAKWRHWIATAPFQSTYIAGYAAEEERVRFSLLGSSLVEQEGDELRKGELSEADIEWIREHLLEPPESPKTTIEYTEKTLREHGGVI
jgi:hypothetical protein